MSAAAGDASEPDPFEVPTELLARAEILPVLIGDVGATLDWNSFPDGTVQRLLISAIPTLHGSIVLLAHRSTSFAHRLLVRGLAEAAAHIHYIRGTDDGKRAPCRAIAVDRGMAIAVRQQKERYDTKEQIKVAHSRVADLTKHATTHGCGKPMARTFRHVSGELTAMAKENPKVAWIEELWHSMSGSAHMSDYDYMLSLGPDGALVVDFPPPVFAATSFNNLLPLVGEMAHDGARHHWGRRRRATRHATGARQRPVHGRTTPPPPILGLITRRREAGGEP
jgi:hypothetical protein